MAAEFALDGYMCAFGKGAGEIGEFSEGHATMPLGARFPGLGIVLPGRLGGEREGRDVGCFTGFSLGVIADKTDKGDSVEVHTFLLFCPFVSGTGSERARLPRQRVAFLRVPERGSQNRQGARAKQKLRSCRAPKKPRSSAETNGHDR